MTIFFTHIMTANGLVIDPEGQEFATLDEACGYAEKSARSLVLSEIQRGRCHVSLELRIEDQHGVKLATVPINAEIIGGERTK